MAPPRSLGQAVQHLGFAIRWAQRHAKASKVYRHSAFQALDQGLALLADPQGFTDDGDTAILHVPAQHVRQLRIVVDSWLQHHTDIQGLGSIVHTPSVASAAMRSRGLKTKVQHKRALSLHKACNDIEHFVGFHVDGERLAASCPDLHMLASCDTEVAEPEPEHLTGHSFFIGTPSPSEVDSQDDYIGAASTFEPTADVDIALVGYLGLLPSFHMQSVETPAVAFDEGLLEFAAALAANPDAGPMEDQPILFPPSNPTDTAKEVTEVGFSAPAGMQMGFLGVLPVPPVSQVSSELSTDCFAESLQAEDIPIVPIMQIVLNIFKKTFEKALI